MLTAYTVELLHLPSLSLDNRRIVAFIVIILSYNRDCCGITASTVVLPRFTVELLCSYPLIPVTTDIVHFRAYHCRCVALPNNCTIQLPFSITVPTTAITVLLLRLSSYCKLGLDNFHVIVSCVTTAVSMFDVSLRLTHFFR